MLNVTVNCAMRFEFVFVVNIVFFVINIRTLKSSSKMEEIKLEN